MPLCMLSTVFLPMACPGARSATPPSWLAPDTRALRLRNTPGMMLTPCLLYTSNLVYFKELSMYIIAGKKKLAKVRAEELPKLVEKAKASNLPEDAQAARDLEDLCNRFEKKLYDLELTRNISVQMSPQIRLIQSNDTMMAEKIQTSIVNTIPLWKSQMVLALGLALSLIHI